MYVSDTEHISYTCLYVYIIYRNIHGCTYICISKYALTSTYTHTHTMYGYVRACIHTHTHAFVGTCAHLLFFISCASSVTPELNPHKILQYSDVFSFPPPSPPANPPFPRIQVSCLCLTFASFRLCSFFVEHEGKTASFL